MAEGNGRGRLDRIEALLEKMGERLDQISQRTTTTNWMHQEQLLKIEANIESMQADEKAYRAAQRERDKVADERVDKLVLSIGELISKIPPAALKS